MGWEDTITEETPKKSKKKSTWENTITEDIVSPEMASAALPTRGTLPESEISASQNLVETGGDILATYPQGITSWAEEAQAGLQAAGKKALGSKEPFSDIYEQDVSKLRQDIANARERSPIATTVGEMGTGIGSAFIPVLGAGKLAGAGGMIARGAVEGLGTAEDKMGWEGATQAGIGAGLGAGGALVSGGLKKLTSANPNAIRANVLGARTSEFKEIGTKERQQIAKELKDRGLFSNSKVDYDVKSGKFISKGKTLENIEKPVRGKLLERLDNATGKIQEEKMKLLGQYADTPIDLDSFEAGLDEVAAKFAKRGTGMEERLADANAIKKQIMDDILSDLEDSGMDQVTVRMVENAKNRLSEDVSKVGANPLLTKTPHNADLYNNYYTAINKKMKALMGDNNYAKLNDAQHKMLTAKTDLVKAIAAEDATTASAGWGGWFNKIANMTLGSPETGLGMATSKETLDKFVPQSAQRAGRLVTEELPFAAIRQLDTSIPSPQIPMRPEEKSGYSFNSARPAFPVGVSPESQVRALPGRMPQSSDFTPMGIVNFKIPRTTQGILENKDKVLAKLIQNGVPHDMVDTINQALESDKEAVSNIAPLIISQFPTIFERSKYQTFDGIIAGPDRAKAADAISKRDDLNSIQRARAINDINKSGKMPQELN